MITIDDFAKKYKVPKWKVEHFLHMLKIDTNQFKEYEEESLKRFLPMMK